MSKRIREAYSGAKEWFRGKGKARYEDAYEKWGTKVVKDDKFEDRTTEAMTLRKAMDDAQHPLDKLRILNKLLERTAIPFLEAGTDKRVVELTKLWREIYAWGEDWALTDQDPDFKHLPEEAQTAYKNVIDAIVRMEYITRGLALFDISFKEKHVTPQQPIVLPPTQRGGYEGVPFVFPEDTGEPTEYENFLEWKKKGGMDER